MQITIPDSIAYADTSDDLSVEDITSAMATSIQTAFNSRAQKSYRWANQAARVAQVGMSYGDTGFQVDTGVSYRYSGSVWIIAALPGSAPSSAASSGGTASIGPDGTVTFTAVTSVSLNGVFDGTGTDSYKIYVSGLAVTGTATVLTRIRSGGVDNSSVGAYNYVGHYTSLAVGPTRYSSTTATWGMQWNGPAAFSAPDLQGEIMISTPVKLTSGGSRWTMQSYAVGGGDRWTFIEGGNGPRGDGFSLIASGGTMSGTVKVVKI